MFLLTCFLVFAKFVVFCIPQNENYCHPELCEVRKTHIGCRSHLAFAPECTIDARLVKLNGSFAADIVHMINVIRQNVASGKFKHLKTASRMLTMQWDDELAYLATISVTRCSPLADECRNTNMFRNVGQLYSYGFWTGDKGKTNRELITKMIGAWKKQSKFVTMKIIKRFAAKSRTMYPLFTQLIQDHSTHVGCGILRQSLNGVQYQYVACNFSYGNTIDRPVYKIGKVGSDCVTGTNPKYSALCTLREPADVNEF